MNSTHSNGMNKLCNSKRAQLLKVIRTIYVASHTNSNGIETHTLVSSFENIFFLFYGLEIWWDVFGSVSNIL